MSKATKSSFGVFAVVGRHSDFSGIAAVALVVLISVGVAGQAHAETDAPVRMAFWKHNGVLHSVPLKKEPPAAGWTDKRSYKGKLVYVLSSERGATHDALEELHNPGYLRGTMDYRHGPLGRMDISVGYRMHDMLNNILDKGYTIVAMQSATPDQVVRAVGDRRTSAILHEGHTGMRMENDEQKFYLLFYEPDGKKIGMTSKRVPEGFKPSPKLRFIETSGCQAARCEGFYRKTFKLKKVTKWLAGWVNQNSFTMFDRFARGKDVDKAIQALPDLSPAKISTK